MEQDHLKQIVLEFIKHYNSFDIDLMIDLFIDDCIFENISNSMGFVECHGKKEIRDIASHARKLFKNRKQTVNNWVIGKDKVAIEIDFEGTLAVDLPNGLKAGNALKLKGVSIYEFEKGKIKRLVDFS